MDKGEKAASSIFSLLSLPDTKLANELIFIRLEVGAEFAFPPERQLAPVQLVHSDAAVHRRTLADSAQRRTFPLQFHYKAKFLVSVRTTNEVRELFSSLFYFTPRPHDTCYMLMFTFSVSRL